jgi:hypothetical protein
MEFDQKDFEPAPICFLTMVDNTPDELVYRLPATPAGYNIPARSLRIRMTNDFDIYASIIEHWDSAQDD